MANHGAIVAVDTGGTFTDAVGVVGGSAAIVKVPSTPRDPAAAVREAVALILDELGVSSASLLVHGTTVATNALLEGRGAETHLVTNAGLEDLLEIGRQNRAELYALEPRPRAALIPPERRIGVDGRRGPHGECIEPLDVAPLVAHVTSLDDSPRSWAVCLLHAYASGADEEVLAAELGRLRPNDPVSVSSRVLPVFREVERASTTVANAFVATVMGAYLRRLHGVADEVAVMSSSGGRLQLEAARALPAATALSGPAGGVVAALDLAHRRGLDGVVSFDMGGTSTDVSLCRGSLPIRHAATIGEHPIHLPTLDIHTIGAGGGSIARVDAGGALAVGPESAGADPGPACYGRGTEATVTDANVVLGRLPAGTLLAGRVPIDATRAKEAVGRVADRLEMPIQDAAEGIVRVAVEKMARAIRRVSVERGADPRALALCCFGGAGGLHACALAETLGMTAIVVPPAAGVFSAVGLSLAVPVAERSRTVLGRTDSEAERARATLIAAASETLGGGAVRTVSRLDMRYEGQSFELAVPFDSDVETARQAFAQAHHDRFGYGLDAPVVAVTVRVRLEGEAPGVEPARTPAEPEMVSGPRALVSLGSTTWVAPGWQGEREGDGTLVLGRGGR